MLVGGDLSERIAARFAPAEWLRDGDRAVHELPIGAEQRDLDAVAGELAQREQDLQRRDAAAGNEDAQSAAVALSRAGDRGLRGGQVHGAPNLWRANPRRHPCAPASHCGFPTRGCGPQV